MSVSLRMYLSNREQSYCTRNTASTGSWSDGLTPFASDELNDSTLASFRNEAVFDRKM